MGVPAGLGGGGRTCHVLVSLITLAEDVVKDGVPVGQLQVSGEVEALMSWLGGCGWGCGCLALGLGLLGGLLLLLLLALPRLQLGLALCCSAADQCLILAVRLVAARLCCWLCGCTRLGTSCPGSGSCLLC